MSPAQSKGMRTIEFILTFAILFFITNAALNFFFPPADPNRPPIELTMVSEKVRIGNAPVVRIVNHSEIDLTLPARCPAPPVDIFFRQSPDDEPAELIPNESLTPCENLLIVPAGETHEVDLTPWKYALFSREGYFSASVDLPENFVTEERTVASTDFRVVEPGAFTKLFRTFVTRPLYNALVFIASWVPGQNLGLAIILLTILIKLLLLIPNQHALEGQMKLQAVQPKMDELKKKYKDDPKRMQEETMKLWKEMKVNPLQSCLPMLLQLPILIGLFFVIRDGVSIAVSKHLLYSVYADLPADFLHHYFLGLDLLFPNAWLFAPLLVILQFIQMKMMSKKKKPKEIVATPTLQSKLQNLDQQTILTYTLPFLIGIFAFQFPAAVSLYWGTSTVFGIGQQWWVMRKKVISG